MPHLQHTRLTRSALLALLSLSACSDAITPAASGTGDPQPPLALAAGGALRDDGIDARDTYFAFNVTTARTADGALADGGGVAITSLEGEYATDESVYLEAGSATTAPCASTSTATVQPIRGSPIPRRWCAASGTACTSTTSGAR